MLFTTYTLIIVETAGKNVKLCENVFFFQKLFPYTAEKTSEVTPSRMACGCWKRLFLVNIFVTRDL